MDISQLAYCNTRKDLENECFTYGYSSMKTDLDKTNIIITYGSLVPCLIIFRQVLTSSFMGNLLSSLARVDFEDQIDSLPQVVSTLHHFFVISLQHIVFP